MTTKAFYKNNAIIDLNIKKQEREEEPVGMVIIYVLPFVLVFLALLVRGL